ncbi:hypothetical protein ACIPY2_20515 [Paenarthrobacter sp. NPDC089675]|uniref:hypothetical protein n=1 Tax=Paenarthrobacter TaxID=1742992 RepID=UPI00380F508B
MSHRRPRSSGEILNLLLSHSQDWVHRRVDALRLDVDGTTRRFVSVDLTVPADRVIAGSTGHVLVPLGVLEKGPIQRLDASHDGKPVPVLGRQDHAELVVEMLEARLPRVLGKAWPRHLRRKLFYEIATCSAETAENIAEDYQRFQRDLLGSRVRDEHSKLQIEEFSTLVGQMLANFVFLVEIKKEFVGQRIVLKYALDQAEINSGPSGRRTLVILQPVPDLGWARSHHMEVGVPSGLVVDSLTLAELGEDEKSDRFVKAVSEGRIGHVNLEPSSSQAIGFLRAEISVAKQGVFFFTQWTIYSLVILVATATLVRMFDDFFIKMVPETIPSPAASILLVGPALLISWMSRLPEHPLVARMIGPLRGMLTLSALALTLMAGLAAVRVQVWVWHAAWWVVVALILAVCVWFLYFTFNWRLERTR